MSSPSSVLNVLLTPKGVYAFAALLLLLIAAPVSAEIFRCQGADGEPLFSNLPCASDAQLVQLREATIIDGGEGVLDRTRRQLKSLKSIPVPAAKKRQPGTSGPDFGDRMAMRRLEIEVDGLERDLRRARTAEKQRALREELKQARSELKSLRKKSSG
ncbi:MAG: DUF4124 domain-containing protein [Alcanivoracaceae bacterium]|nr:DUF4124 domain-containing protein [Alcanivoracaceae bacterium]